MHLGLRKPPDFMSFKAFEILQIRVAFLQSA
jgi:hypothetical protein